MTMTRDEREDIIIRRKNGETFQSIADSYGVTRQCIQQMLAARGISVDGRYLIAERCIYPKLSNFIREHKLSAKELGETIGFKPNSYTTTRVMDIVTGKRAMTIEQIKRILELTEMSFEECFSTEVKE